MEVYEVGLSEEMVKLCKYGPLRFFETPKEEQAVSRVKRDVFDLERVERLMEGAIDTHIHIGPDPYLARLGDPVELALEACDAGISAVLFKAHFQPTSPFVPVAQRIVDQYAKEKGKKRTEIFGGIVLNRTVGGLNPEAVIASAKVGGKVVWPPNVHSRHHHKVMGWEGGIDVIGENDKPVPAMMEILSLIAEGDMILALSCLGVRDRFVLIEAAREMGIKRINVIHPNQPNSKMTIEQMRIAAEKGAWIELTSYDFSFPEFDWDEFMEAYKVVGPDHIIAATDEGSFYGLRPVVAMRKYITGMLYRGIPDKDVEKMVKINPRRLLY